MLGHLLGAVLLGSNISAKNELFQKYYDWYQDKSDDRIIRDFNNTDIMEKKAALNKILQERGLR